VSWIQLTEQQYQEKKILELHDNGVINYLGKTDNVREQLANA
jgi:hypothetical protein